MVKVFGKQVVLRPIGDVVESSVEVGPEAARQKRARRAAAGVEEDDPVATVWPFDDVGRCAGERSSMGEGGAGFVLRAPPTGSVA